MILENNFISAALHFSPNELVVHERYGIGKFIGIENISANNIKYDCLKLLYDKDDILYVPVENMHFIKRYGYDFGRLDKLGSKNWEKRKISKRKIINDYVINLLKISAARNAVVFDSVTINQDRLSKFLSDSTFEYTKDQNNAINTIKLEIEQGKLINRLICGEVGSGKTEVSMVSIFMLLDLFPKSQVAFLCPTSILCRQHFINFKSRFEKFGFSVVELSNLNKKSDNIQAREKIKNGECNIIIGTHAILNHFDNFLDLKMLIIDEEQCFGVKQKSSLSNIYHKMHIISLSATPIPRTLHMAMNNICDISIIQEKPFSSSAIHTQVIHYNADLIKSIIKKEVERYGQVFYVTPKICYLEDVMRRLKNLFPDLNIVILHGSMSDKDIDQVTTSFYNREIDILIATTIVAFGLNVLNANTILIERPDLLGLSQLYQLRGRVARGEREGYAYYILEEDLISSKKTKKRLDIISRIDNVGHLGISQEDLYMRGGGSIVGTDQSGQIKDIGVEMYYEMLHDSLSNQNNSSSNQIITVINCQVSAFIPKDYIKDEVERIYFYNMIAKNNDNNDIHQIELDIENKYGALPLEVHNFFMVAKIKLICENNSIVKVTIENNIIVIVFLHSNFEQLFMLNIINIAKEFLAHCKINIEDYKLFINTNHNAQDNLKQLYNILLRCCSKMQEV